MTRYNVWEVWLTYAVCDDMGHRTECMVFVVSDPPLVPDVYAIEKVLTAQYGGEICLAEVTKTVLLGETFIGKDQ